MTGWRWRWILFGLFLIGGGILFWTSRTQDGEARRVAEVEAEKKSTPNGWRTFAQGIRQTVQPYLSPVRPKNLDGVAERWMAAPQEMRTGPSKMKLMLSTEWVYTVNNRSRTVEFVPLRGVKTGKDFVREVERVKRETGAMVQLVFTEKDADPSPENRIVLTERLYLKNPSSTLERQMVKELGLKLVNQPNYAPGIKIYAAGDALQALASLESLRDAAAGTEPTPVLAFAARLAAAPNDPLYPQQWHLKATNQTSADGQVSVTAGEDCNVESVWGYPGNGGYRGRGINIAILDNGVDLNHPDLVANLLPAMYHYDFLFPIYDQSFYGTYQSVGGGGPKYTNDNHGTAVAGVAAAQGNNSIGVTGVAPEASLISYRILGSTPYPNQFNTWTPTDFNGAALSTNNSIIHIKNNSWGYASYYHGYDNLEAAALQNARSSGRWSKGTIVVFAAMNELMQAGRSDYYVHISDIGTIGVAALDHTGGQAAYSNPGSSVLVAAPSGNWFPTGPATTTTDRTGGSGYNSDSGNNNYTDLNYTATFNGTSSASPVVSGVVALMLEANPNLKWRDVQEILLRTARKNALSDSGWTNNGAGFRINDKFGFGCVDAAAAVQLASGWTNNLPGQWKRSITNSSSGVIGNNDGSVLERQFTVSASSKIRCESVTVTVNITHPSRGDLRIELVSPAGTVSTLAAPYTVNGAVDDLGGWTFRTVRNWGERDAGTWTLRVRDQQAGESGPASLDSAVLEIYGVNATSGPLPPAFLRLASGATVSEHAAISTVAAVVESSDENGSDVISLVPGEGDAHNGYFEVSGKNLVVKQDIDFNNLSNGVYDALSNTYSLKVRLKATDPSGQYSLERALLLPVSAQNDYPPMEIYLQDYYGAFGVRSGHKIALLGPINSGAPLGKFCAFDQDRPDLGGDQLAYTLVGGVGADDNSKFSIAGDTLSANTSLAPLTLATYKIRVRATDNGGSMIEKPFLIFQTPTNNLDSDGDFWEDYVELVAMGNLALNPWQDNDGDGFMNMFDPRPLESPWTQNGVKLSPSLSCQGFKARWPTDTNSK